ncbi:NAD-dependent dehydratase, partial [Candidatus Marsarchaeota G1 archaeon OSP_B]
MVERLLVTGGNGFLGSYLVEKALNQGFEVVVVDDLSTSSCINVPKDAKFVRCKVEEFSDDTRYDFVAHFAARPSPEDYMKHPVETMLSNSLGTLRTLEIAKRSNAVYLYASSSEVYGDASVIPTPEDYFGYVNPVGVRSCYDEGKRFSEALCMAYHRQFGLDVRIERPFNVYGPRMRADGVYGRVIPRFLSQALAGKELTVHGDGNQTRSFLFVHDWLEATWTLLTKPGLSAQVVNIGSPNEVKILELAKLVIKVTKSSSKIVFLPPRPEDPRRRAADITRARSLLS